jgi:hypothetical protein
MTKTTTTTKKQAARKRGKSAAARAAVRTYTMADTDEGDLLPCGVETAAEARAAHNEPPAPYELNLVACDIGPAVMLRGPAFCLRADYEAFTDAGGAVECRGFALELR